MQKPKKVPMRKCVVTGERLPKNELLRIVRTPDGELVVDPTGKQNGHGAYIKKDATLIASLQKSHSLEKLLEVQEIPEEFWETLANEMK